MTGPAGAPDPELVVVERLALDAATVALLTLNRPEARNPIDRATLAALAAVLDDLAGDPAVRAVVITGAGPAFSSGGDLKKYQALYRDPAAFDEFLRAFSGVCRSIETHPAVVVAMVNGTCVAGGLELALACDLVTIAEGARIGDGHLRFAQLPGAGGSQRLVRAVGVSRARQWLLTGRLFDAATAVEHGVACASFAPDDLLAGTLDLLGPLTGYSPLALARMKGLVLLAQDGSLDQGLDAEIDVVKRYTTSSHDAMEGLMAFAERRSPTYRGD